jgi:hypothetical protein
LISGFCRDVDEICGLLGYYTAYASLRYGNEKPVTRKSSSHLSQKLKMEDSAGKCMFTIFWDYRGIIHQEYMVKGKKINFKTYAETLKRL